MRKHRFGAAISALALCAQCACTYFLTARGGEIFYREQTQGAWLDTGVPLSALPSERDRAMISQGIRFPARAALTRALEDFCS